MALVNSAFTVNVTPGAMPPIVHVSEYDVGRTYTVTINGENGSAFNIPTGTTATIEGTLNGSVGFTQSATISNNQVSFALSESMTAYSGKAWCKIKLTLNDEPIQTCAFVLVVDRAGVEAETVIGAPGFEGQIQDAVDDYLAENQIPVDQEQIQDAVDSWFDDHGGALTVDNVLSGTSENPVQNKVVTAALNNKGTYSKPSGGIPKSDLASAVQKSLGKADTALQQHQSLTAYRTSAAQDTIDAAQDTAIAAKYTKPSTGIPKTDLASNVQTSLGKADTALQEHQSLVGYATERYVRTAISNIPDELPTVTAADNGKFLRVVNGAWAAQTVPSAEGASF